MYEFKILEKAKTLARTSKHPRFHLGCIIAKGNYIFAEGTNSQKTHPSVNGFVHAEIDALMQIRHYNYDLTRAIAFVARIRKDGSVSMARPCLQCALTLFDAGIRKIVFTTNTGYSVETLLACYKYRIMEDGWKNKYKW